jgi:hypothetical protein
MTKRLGYQRLVYSKEEALEYFLDSELADCRINAYPNLTEYKDVPRYKPNFLFLDIDRDNFKTAGKYELALYNTLKNIKEKLQTAPTVLFTGGGYHIYQPVDIPTALENITEFQEFDKPSEQFLRFAKDILSNNRADKQNNPSFRSCLLRIPESINSKYGNKVKIVKKWNGIRAPITRDFIEEFRTYLIQKKIDDYNYRQKILKARRYTNNNDNKIRFWIEKLLNTPILDFRKNAINLILAPYLVNVKKLSYQQSFNILTDWLQKCNSLRKLDFKPEYLVKSALSIAIQKGIPPMKLVTLKDRNLEIYNILHEV